MSKFATQLNPPAHLGSIALGEAPGENPDRQWSFAAILAAITILLVIVLLGRPAAPANVINDVSWPNCGARSIDAKSGIVGVTGGLDFRANPCLESETSWFGHYRLYINTGYPGLARAQKFDTSPRACDPGDESCVAYDYGYNAALYAINYASRLNVHSIAWWLDVESDNSWSDNTAINRASLQGSYDAIHRKIIFVGVGIYSYPAQWQLITGNWHNGLPAWVATGSNSPEAARAACLQPAFDGGLVWYGQYTDGLDINYFCNPKLGGAAV